MRALNTASVATLVCLSVLTLEKASADVPTGTETSARAYYKSLTSADSIQFSTPDKIFTTTLDDVATYLGYKGLTGGDLQNASAATLMQLNASLIQSRTAAVAPPALQQPNLVISSLGEIPFEPEDILVARFFAPKIMNIDLPEATRPLGWRRLVRLRARPGSTAETHNISCGILLFNIFTPPGAVPFSPTDESINTQVMLLTKNSSVPKANHDGPATLYWLDYSPLSKGGFLSLALNASFDANELPQANGGARSYFVPNGCVACHGNNGQRSMVNYLDTDHWYDRLPTDFPALKASNLPLLADATTNDPSDLSYKIAFDAIRRFNVEADEQAKVAQPHHDETLAAARWLELHASSNSPVPPIDRAIGSSPKWSSQDTEEVKVLGDLDQYCFRCHGSIKFSVFDKSTLLSPLYGPMIEEALKKDAPLGVKMPPDRDLPDNVRAEIKQWLIANSKF